MTGGRAVHEHDRRGGHDARARGERRARRVRLDFNGSAPIAAHAPVYRLSAASRPTRSSRGRASRTTLNVYGSTLGGRAGSVAGLAVALERCGTMELRDVVAPAIALARDGFVS